MASRMEHIIQLDRVEMGITIPLCRILFIQLDRFQIWGTMAPRMELLIPLDRVQLRMTIALCRALLIQLHRVQAGITIVSCKEQLIQLGITMVSRRNFPTQLDWVQVTIPMASRRELLIQLNRLEKHITLNSDMRYVRTMMTTKPKAGSVLDRTTTSLPCSTTLVTATHSQCRTNLVSVAIRQDTTTLGTAAYRKCATTTMDLPRVTIKTKDAALYNSHTKPQSIIIILEATPHVAAALEQTLRESWSLRHLIKPSLFLTLCYHGFNLLSKKLHIKSLFLPWQIIC